VVCSGFGDLEVARRLTGANGVGFLAKPYDQQSLTACLQQMLGA
jgi:FixJ family two-component response regulator